jgi:glycosyltransferase involved in cell wall biosynthesis
MPKLSILIPARNEEFLLNTINDILLHSEEDTDIWVGLDGEWNQESIPQHDRVNIVFYPESIGQRAMTNQLAKLAQGKYLMKLDAHCSLRQGFDKSMLKAFKETGDDVVMVPTMKNLHAFDWVCECGIREYQDKGETCKCGKKRVKEILWYAKKGPNSTSFRFDSEPHFQYFGDYKAKQTGDLVESMSIQGSCFMVSREKYFDFNLCDEAFGSWGSQGIEVACKFWLSGGRVIVNTRTWYAHLFRTKPGVFGFPYKQQESKIQEAKQKVREIFLITNGRSKPVPSRGFWKSFGLCQVGPRRI